MTAAKQLVSGLVKIDMLAGPSELLIVADSETDPAMAAADLLAQAEHDTEARTVPPQGFSDFPRAFCSSPGVGKRFRLA